MRLSVCVSSPGVSKGSHDRCARRIGQNTQVLVRLGSTTAAEACAAVASASLTPDCSGLPNNPMYPDEVNLS